MINATASASSTFVVRCRRIFFVGPHRRGTNPKIPIESRRNRIFARGPINPLRPDRTIAPNVQFERLADQAGLNDFDGATETAAGASLVAHLGGDLLLPGEVTQVAGLENRVGQRFLNVGVLAHFHRARGGECMMMVGRGNDHRVDVLANFVEHFTVVAIDFGLGVAFFLWPGV